MAILSKSTPTALGSIGTVNTTPANTLLAASSTVTRWVRGITVVNGGTATTWNFGIGTAAILTAANSIWFGKTIAAGETFVHYFPGRGRRLMTPATDALIGFAGQANVSVSVEYDELDLT
jgi:hypothetical protein